MRRSRWMWVAAIMVTLLAVSPAVLARQITFWSGSYRDNDPFVQYIEKELLPRFAKEKRITVTHARMSSRAAEEKWLAGEAPADVVLTADVIRLGQAGYLLSLNQYTNRWNELKYVFPDLMGTDSATRTIYGLPYLAEIYGIAFNKDAFTKAGLNANSPPNSWEALRTAAEKCILTWSGRIVRTGIETTWDVTAFQGFLLQTGETGWSPDLKQSRLYTDRAVETLEYLSQLYLMGYPPAEELWNEARVNEVYRKFPEGMTAMGWGRSNLASQMKARNAKWQQELGWFLPRRFPSNQPTAIASTRYLAIARRARDPQSAWEFIRWLMGPDIMVAVHAKAEALPTRNDLASRVQRQMLHLLAPYQNLRYGKLPPPQPLIPVVTRTEQQDLQNAFRQLLKGKLDPRSFLSEWEAKAQAWVREQQAQTRR